MASISDQNWLVWNQGKNPLVNFNFMLRVEMLYDLPCKGIRAFSRELEYDFIQEGGLNDYVHMRRKPITRPFTLEIDRYVGVDYMDPMPLGADLALPVLLFVSRNHDQFIPGVVARTYVFTGCTVMKKTYGDLAGDQSGLLVETTTLGYREMLCVDIPWSEVGDNIPKNVTSPPTNSKTKEQSASELKEKSQNMYERAKKAQDKAADEYDDAEVTALINELTAAKDSLIGKDPKVQELKNRLQNRITNLTLRQESVSEAQASCKKQHDLCKDANDEVQGKVDTDVSGIEAGYEKVKKYAEQTEYHEREVRELEQYISSARSLLKEAEAARIQEEQEEQEETSPEAPSSEDILPEGIPTENPPPENPPPENPPAPTEA